MAVRKRPPLGGLKPAAQLAARHPHGVRLRYIAGCRCVLCRKANSAYENERQKARRAGDWNGLVDAAPVRSHLLKLRRAGIGRRTVAACTDVGQTVLAGVINKSRLRIRARSAKKILAVTTAMRADHALLPAAQAKAMLADLVEEGFTKTEIARRLGYKTHALQVGNTGVITVKNAARVRRLHERLTGDVLVPA